MNGDRKASFDEVGQAIKAGCSGLRIAWAPVVEGAGGTPPLLFDLEPLQAPPVFVPSVVMSVRGGLDVSLGAAVAEAAHAQAQLLPEGGGAAVATKTLLVRGGVPITLAFRAARSRQAATACASRAFRSCVRDTRSPAACHPRQPA